MIAGLKPYAQVKDSGQLWLGALPSHWSVLPNRTLFSEVKARDNVAEKMLSVTIKRGVIPQQELLGDTSKKDSSRQDKAAYKLVCPGDIAYNKMRAWQGALGVSELRGIVSPAYVVVRPIGDIIPRYFHYVFRTPSFAKEAERWSYGITSDMWSLRPEHFKLIYSCLPPREEQAAIVRFLDHVDRRIRRAISNKLKLIMLLEEQKQAIIHRAVTRGLDPDVKLKPSGVEWLGDVPEHWEVRSFSRSAIERADYRGATPTKTESGVFLVTARNVRRGWIDYQASKEYVAESDYATIMRRGLPRIGDILLTMEAPLGNVAIVDREDVAFAQRVVRFRLSPKLFVPKFAVSSMLTRYFKDQLLSRGTGSTALGIKASKLPQLQMLCPPVAEQNRIIDYLVQEVGPAEVAIKGVETEIALLREYLTRMISDVVTGKLDVRVAADQLPDEIDPLQVVENDETESEISEESVEFQGDDLAD